MSDIVASGYIGSYIGYIGYGYTVYNCSVGSSCILYSVGYKYAVFDWT